MSDNPMLKQKICFLGSINCLTFWYALELRGLGYHVDYYVDYSPEYVLHRPEFHLPDICYPYPTWIKEISRPSRLLNFYLPFSKVFLFSRFLSHEGYAMVVTTGIWHRIIPVMRKNSVRVCFFAGSDLEVYSSYQAALKLVKFRSVLAPFNLVLRLIETYLLRLAICQADAINYFQEGAFPNVDRMLSRIFKRKFFVRMKSRGVSALKVSSATTSTRSGSGVVILSATRHLWEHPMPQGFSLWENKGNDIMIRGISNFYKDTNTELVVHLFEKGPHVLESKRLAVDLGIQHLIHWHEECTPIELRQFFADADIVIDQLGNHMLGDSGVTGLLACKPVIANSHAAKYKKAGQNPLPICEAVNESDVAHWLNLLVFNPGLRDEYGKRGQEYLLSTNSSITTAHELIGLLDLR
jgi:hypothetical protein